MSYKMLMNKQKFMKTEFGQGLEGVIRAWDMALQQNREDSTTLRDLAWCQAQWEVYRLAMKQFYGVEYYFTRTDEYFGVCTEDESDYLIKVYRDPMNSIQYIAKDDEVKRAIQKTQKLQKIAREYKESHSEPTFFDATKAVIGYDKKEERPVCDREALRRAAMETMNIMLESELFTNAAKRGKEDYESTVSLNLSLMADSIAGRYERIFNKIRE